MEIEENSKTLIDYLQIAKRRKNIIIIPILILLEISIIVTLALPPLYNSEATILIEQQSIPVDLVRSTVDSLAEQRIKQIEQKLMTVPNLQKIIDKFKLYSNERYNSSPSSLADKFREQAHLDMVTTSIIGQGRKSTATLAFKLGFDHKEAETAKNVANELVTLFLDENKKARTKKAQETTTFLEEEADKYSLYIKTIETNVINYKKKHSNSLPELRENNRAAINQIDTNLIQLQFHESMLEEKIITLQRQLLLANSVVSTGNNKTMANSLPMLEAQYNDLLGKYSKSHPDVKALKRKIDNFDRSKNNNLKSNNPLYLQLEDGIKITNLKKENLHKNREALLKKRKEIEKNIAETPKVELEYYELTRNLENYKNLHQELRAKALRASLSLEVEEQEKAEKFTVIEYPYLSLKPEKPNRLKFIAIGFAMSIGCGLGLGFLVEIMDGSIRGHKNLATLTGMEPLIVIPYIQNKDDLNNNQQKIMNFMIFLLVLLIGITVAINFIYMSFDVMWTKVLYRLGSL